MNTHYCENEPEDEADKKYVCDGRDGLNQGIDDDLKQGIKCHKKSGRSGA